MPKPLAICIEELDPSESTYTRCVALPGRQPGLRLDSGGQVMWQIDDDVSCELWVSADDRLMLYRPEGAAPVALQRAERSLEVPCGKPVVVLDQDLVSVGSRRVRIHVHGEAPATAAPTLLPTAPGTLRRIAEGLSMTLAVGLTVAAVGCAPIEIREAPPSVMPPSPSPTIEVREAPPSVMPPSPSPTPAVPTVTPMVPE